MKVRTVFVHKLVRNGTSDLGNARFRLYTNVGSINMQSDAAFGITVDKSNPNGHAIVGQWVELKMFRTTFYEASVSR